MIATSSWFLHDLPRLSALRIPDAIALIDGHQGTQTNYQTLWADIAALAARLQHLFAIKAGDRVCVWLEKRSEFVVAAFASTLAGGVFVPINPQLKVAQAQHILQDCSASLLITTESRAALLREQGKLGTTQLLTIDSPTWSQTCPPHQTVRCIDEDLAAIFYTSGSTGQPKGVMLSHRNLVVGAQSVASYLENTQQDCLLAALPLSFDAGFSQLTTAFHVGARVVLLNYLLPRDILRSMALHQVTGLTAVPPLWSQLAPLEWPAAAAQSLRYFANTGGHMPLTLLTTLREKAPQAKPWLMYGLTEAFRATCLPPEEVDRRPDSIGKAIPNAEILVLRPDGSECAADEPGELVQRGALVAQGYWNNPERSAERYKTLPLKPGQTRAEVAVFSGDTVRRDIEGFLYFIGRRDEMIKTSGYRVSPTEIEEVCYLSGLVEEVAALGLPHSTLGHQIALVLLPKDVANFDRTTFEKHLKQVLPSWMQPSLIEVRKQQLPRNPNGKLDRAQLIKALQTA